MVPNHELVGAEAMGRLPSQHPPDWKNITGPALGDHSSIASRATGVATTRAATPEPVTLFSLMLGTRFLEVLV